MVITVGLKIKGKTITDILQEAVILHEGWEMDNKAVLARFEDGSQAIVYTSHGTPYLATIAEMARKLKETESSAASIRQLMSQFSNPGTSYGAA